MGSDASGMTLNMVRASLVLEDTGHGLVRCRQWIPKEHVKDPAKSVRGHTSCRPAVSYEGRAGDRDLKISRPMA